MKTLRCSQLLAGLAIALYLAGFGGAANAGEPQDRVQETINEALAVLKDASLKTPEKKAERRAKIRAIVSQRFGFDEMGQRAMGRHWRKLTPAQRKEFIPLFSDLLERSYIGKIESAVTEEELKILYTKETIDKDGYAEVRTEIVNPNDLNFGVDYRLLKRDGNWQAYDIVIEGVSLVNNYRTQFNNIISQESYEGLIKKLKLKIEQEEAAQ